MRWSSILLVLQLWGDVRVSLSQNVCATLPDVPHGHVSDDTSKDAYTPGNIIHFSCETGYMSGLTIRYACTDNGWMPLNQGKCYLKPCQLPEETPGGFYQLIKGDDFVFGSTIKYFCNEGYEMVSKEDTRTCLLNRWSNHVPICQPVSCDPPTAYEGMTVRGLPENDDKILPNQFLTFSCKSPDRFLNGSSQLICGKDGEWDSPFPSCDEFTCTIGEMHPYLRIEGNHSANSKFKISQRIRFYCVNDYGLDGAAEIECSSTGQWNHAIPRCTEKCRVPRLPGNIQMWGPSQSRVPPTQLRMGQKLSFTCPSRGEVLRGNAEVQCLPSGQWSDPFPTCGAPIGCEQAPPLMNGDIRGSAKFHYENNERAQYVCQRWHIMVGEPYRICKNGEWVGQMECLKPCTVNEDLMRRHNIIFRHRAVNKLYSVHDDVIGFTCVAGTTHDGVVNMRQKCLDGVILLPTCQ